MNQLLGAFVAIVAGVGACALYYYGANLVLDLIFPFRDSGPRAVRNQRISSRIRPWLFLGPAVLILAIYLVYPVIDSVRLSFFNRTGQEFVGLANYEWAVNDSKFRESILNNLMWLVVVPALSTFAGLVIAFLTDRIWWGNIAKSIIFMPMAISFVGASIIWRFMYAYRGEGLEQIGLLNQIVVWFGGQPQQWLINSPLNTFFLIVVLIWVQTGFAMVVLSAAIKGVPIEQMEAAELDGTNAWQRFWSVTVPGIRPTLVVVVTTISIASLKVFDIVRTMTAGNYDTSVIANEMYSQLKIFENGRSAAFAVLLFLLVLPLVIYNARQLKKEREIR